MGHPQSCVWLQNMIVYTHPNYVVFVSKPAKILTTTLNLKMKKPISTHLCIAEMCVDNIYSIDRVAPVCAGLVHAPPLSAGEEHW